MAQLDSTEKPLDITDDDLIPFSATSSSGDRSQTEIGSSGADLSISRSSSFSRLNASAPEFVPRAPSPAPVGGHPRVVKIHHHPPPPAVIHVFHPTPPPPPTVSPQFIPPGPPIGVYEYYGGAIGGGGFGDQESVQAPADSDSTLPAREGLSEDIVQKITKQVEYYFSDANLATTEHLMRFISKDPDGFVEPHEGECKFRRTKLVRTLRTYKSFAAFRIYGFPSKCFIPPCNFPSSIKSKLRLLSKIVEHLTHNGPSKLSAVPISVVASFKKIKALVHNNFLLANALRTSSKLVISDDGKKVRRLQPFTEADVEELQSRIVVAENLPEDHSYQNLMKIFSAAGSVKTIRTCYPQTPNGTTAPTNRSSKLDMLFCNKLHAFVEYETVEDAERAVAEVNKERNWRSGLRLRLLNKCMAKHSSGRGRKAGNDGDGAGEEEEVYSNSTNQVDDPSQQAESAFETLGGGEEGANEREAGGRRGKARGKGRGRGRVQYHNINNHHRGGHGHGHAIGTPPANNPVHNEQSAAVKQPPVPRMPDGTRGFTMGRGKPSFVASSSSTVAAS